MGAICVVRGSTCYTYFDILYSGYSMICASQSVLSNFTTCHIKGIHQAKMNDQSV